MGDQLAERKCAAVGGMTVVVECDIPQPQSHVDALMSRREFRAGLHPLDAPRDFPLHLRALSNRTVNAGAFPVSKPASLSFSINGGELQKTTVHLPEAGVYPWALLNGEGDEVSITFTRLSGGEM